jgi:hypothetical protein
MLELATIEAALHRLYIGAVGTSLRKEDRQKAREVTGFLGEIERALPAHRSPLTLVDAASGKACLGLLAAELLLGPRGQLGHVTLIERDRGQAARARLAARTVIPDGSGCTVTEAEVGAAVWPTAPDLVVALHACGPASDAIIDQAVASRAVRLMLVPCCTSRQVAATALAVRRADELGLPRHAEVRRQFVEAMVAAERTLRLEAAGYKTTVCAFVPPTVSRYHLLWRAQRVCEPARMRRATAAWRRLHDLAIA